MDYENKSFLSGQNFIAGLAVGLIFTALIGIAVLKGPNKISNLFSSDEQNNKTEVNTSQLEKEVLPSEGAVLPVKWNDLGKQMVDKGVIDAQKFEEVYSQRGGLTEEEKKLLYDSDNGNLVINQQNSGTLLNLLWALGLGNKNPILDNGPMQDPKYEGAGNFASTGGWTIAEGEAMDHYSKYNFITLTEEQQKMVESVSKGIYRPCCNNSTYFPDCNHGMAMLGLLELLASQGASEEEMYKIALIVNSYWFPDTYINIAKYMKEKENTEWKNVDPKRMLGIDFSSGSGYQDILSKVAPVERKSGGGCGV